MILLGLDRINLYAIDATAWRPSWRVIFDDNKPMYCRPTYIPATLYTLHLHSFQFKYYTKLVNATRPCWNGCKEFSKETLKRVDQTACCCSQLMYKTFGFSINNCSKEKRSFFSLLRTHRLRRHTSTVLLPVQLAILGFSTGAL